MKFAHLSDLHLGKTVNGYSMLEEQKDVLAQCLDIFEKQQVEGVILAGDIYDRTQPPVDAIHVLDWFLTELHKGHYKVFMIAGNHDSGERIEFVSGVLKNQDIYVEGVYQGELKEVVMEDEYGPLHVYLLPFLRPSHVNRYIEHEKDTVKTYEQAFARVLEMTQIDESARNLLVAHQFFTGAHVVDGSSEELIVGGLDQISSDYLKGFDYVALGHIHGPQKIQKETIRYCGTLLPYSFAEANQEKQVLIIDMKEKGNVSIESIPIQLKHPFVRLKGYYNDFLKTEMVQKYKDCYLEITLQDETPILDVSRILLGHYPYLMHIQYEKNAIFNQDDALDFDEVESLSPIELFNQFYYRFHQVDLNEDQKDYLLKLMNEIEETEGSL